VGIIGSGWVSQNRHIPSYLGEPRCKIVAITDNRPGAAKIVARKFSIPKAYEDIDLFFESEKPDIVSICTSPWSHSKYTIQALQSSCHVITEKPMAMNLIEADQMITAAHENGKKLSVCHNFLFSKSVRSADELIRTGELGQIKSAMAFQLGSPNRRLPDWYNRLPGGLFYDESPHILYIMNHFIGNFNITNANMIVNDPNLPQNVSQVHIDVSAEETSGSITMIFDSPLSEWLIVLVGAKRILCLDIFRDILINLGTDSGHKPYDVLKTSLIAINQEILGITNSGMMVMRRKLLFGHDRLIKGFVDSIVKDIDPPVTAEEGRNIVRLQHEIIKQCRLT
jgi:predicted dehydrogenase